MKIRIKNLKEQIKYKVLNVNYLEVVNKKILILLWIWYFFPEILYLIAGIEEKPDPLIDPVSFLIVRAISVILTRVIIRIVSKIIEKRIIPKIIDSLKKWIQQHNKILSFVVSVIIAKFCSFNVISLSIAIYNTPVINFILKNLELF